MRYFILCMNWLNLCSFSALTRMRKKETDYLIRWNVLASRDVIYGTKDISIDATIN